MPKTTAVAQAVVVMGQAVQTAHSNATINQTIAQSQEKLRPGTKVPTTQARKCQPLSAEQAPRSTSSSPPTGEAPQPPQRQPIVPFPPLPETTETTRDVASQTLLSTPAPPNSNHHSPPELEQSCSTFQEFARPQTCCSVGACFRSGNSSAFQSNSQSGCYQSCLGRCMQSIVQMESLIRLNLMVARFSGAMAGIGMVLVADCWLAHPPFIVNVIATLTTLFGALLLNTVEWSIIVSDDQRVHRQVVLLLALSYGAIFFQVGHVVWNLIQAGGDKHASTWEEASNCHTHCCIAMEGYYVLFMFVSCSLLRFGEPLLRGDAYNRVDRGDSAVAAQSHTSSITATLCGAAAFVAGALLQMFASFGRFGQDTALLVPIPYLMMVPLLFIVRVKAGVTSTPTWQNFNCFLPALTYVFSTAWPLTLFHRGYLDKTQYILGSVAIVLFLVTSRAMVFVIDGHISKAGSTYSGDGFML